MSMNLQQSLAAISGAIDKAAGRVAAFRATVSSGSNGKVAITRLGQSTADTQAYARVSGLAVSATDEVLVIPVNGEPVVIGKLQRASASYHTMDVPLAFDDGTIGESIRLTPSDGNISGQSITLTRWRNTVTLGPWMVSDIPGTATTQASLGFATTTTTFGTTARDIRMPFNGSVVGMFMASNTARTAGTAIARLRIGGVDKAFNSGACALDGTNTTSDSSLMSGILAPTFVSGETLGVNIQTSGFTPTTADLMVWVTVAFADI